MAAPETTNNVTVRKLTSLMSQLWTKIKNALQEKQDDLGISSSGDAGKFLNEQGDWATPAGGGVTGVKGANESSYRTGNVSLSASNIGAATASQGTKADSAVQPDDVARTGYSNVPGGQYLCFRLDNSSLLRYGSIAILSSHQAYQILDLLSFNHTDDATGPLNNMSLMHVSGGKGAYQKSKVYWMNNDSFTYIFFYFGNNGYHRVSYILTGAGRNNSNIGIYATTDGLPSGTTELTSETYVPRISGTAGTAVGSTNQPVYVADDGAIKACNIFYA